MNGTTVQQLLPTVTKDSGLLLMAGGVWAVCAIFFLLCLPLASLLRKTSSRSEKGRATATPRAPSPSEAYPVTTEEAEAERAPDADLVESLAALNAEIARERAAAKAAEARAKEAVLAAAAAKEEAEAEKAGTESAAAEKLADEKLQALAAEKAGAAAAEQAVAAMQQAMTMSEAKHYAELAAREAAVQEAQAQLVELQRAKAAVEAEAAEEARRRREAEAALAARDAAHAAELAATRAEAGEPWWKGAVHPVRGRRPRWLPGPSEGWGLASAPRSAA